MIIDLPESYVNEINSIAWKEGQGEDIIPFDTDVQPHECIDTNLFTKKKRYDYTLH